MEDSTGFATNTATVVYCSNVSGLTASVRLLILSGSAVVGDITQQIGHGNDLSFATQNVLSIQFEVVVATGGIGGGGTINIESTQSGVFCSAYLMDTDTSGPNGVALHLIRVNGHPGVEE